jgi:hypothetical protein
MSVETSSPVGNPVVIGVLVSAIKGLDTAMPETAEQMESEPALAD